jgi:hypothetical protein
MRTARDQVHLGPTTVQRGTDVRTDRPGAENRNLHRSHLPGFVYRIQ